MSSYSFFKSYSFSYPSYFFSRNFGHKSCLTWDFITFSKFIEARFSKDVHWRASAAIHEITVFEKTILKLKLQTLDSLICTHFWVKKKSLEAKRKLDIDFYAREPELPV